jgi:two-component system, chemotaxis family, protein-glutamate methylesterase/glutaminase
VSGKIKVLLIEDSGLMRLIISDILRTDTSIEIVDTAENGKEGVEKTLKYHPDVVVTDLLMPHYDGVYAVKHIMEQKPTPIVVLSSLEKADPVVFDALKEGAVDFVDKPKEKVISNIRDVNHILIGAVKAAQKANVTPLRGVEKAITHTHTFESKLNYEIIVIGASTGGPGAIEKVMDKLPANLSIPVVIAQHMPERFLESFAKRLDALTPLKVKLAEKGEILAGGTVYITPGHSNTKIGRDAFSGNITFAFTKREFREFNFPSVDCLFLSVAETYKQKAISVILTGMGKDGTEGMKAIFDVGGYTIAQDEASSVVYGMPKNAVDNGIVKKSVPLYDISSFIIGCL